MVMSLKWSQKEMIEFTNDGFAIIDEFLKKEKVVISKRKILN